MNLSINSTESEPTFEKNEKSVGKLEICIITVWLVSWLFDVIVFATIFKSRPNLTHIEFIIIVTIRVYSVFLKIIVILAYIGAFLNVRFLTQIMQILTQFVLANGCFIFSMTLLYYSFYHITCLSRTKIFLILFNLIRSPKIFLIYSLTVVILSALISTMCLVILYPQIFDADYRATKATVFAYMRQTFVLSIVCLIIPPISPSLVYLIATVITCYSRLFVSKKTARSHMIDQESKRFRQNLSLLLRFLILVIFNLAYILPKSIYAFLSIYCKMCIINIVALNYSGDVFFLLMPFIQIYVHKTLRQTFVNNFRKIF